MKHIAAPLAGVDIIPFIEGMLCEVDLTYRKHSTRRFPIRYGVDPTVVSPGAI
jgi:hypothetical protein